MLEEAADAGVGIFGAEHLGEGLGLEVEPVVEAAVEATVDDDLGHAHGDHREFLTLFADRVGKSRYYASSLYAASLPHKVRAAAVKPIFESMVALSDDGDLLERFIALPAPKLFMYGAQNNSLSYLQQLDRNGVELAEIPHSAHFPMYSNPPEMWRRITHFIKAHAKGADA